MTGRLKLLIAIPALNEEESIESIIERTCAAQEYIVAHSPVTDVEITVVSDGSTDRTVERASRYTDRIRLIIFKENRGYGAAIKKAWFESDADLLGFLDADGTCNPEFFAELCNTLDINRADMVLGGRLHAESEMPLTRRIGNVFFALLLSLFSSKRIRDTASGMRVIRRSCLHTLLPLPDGLHFTPAMSSRAMLSDELKAIEIPMPYHERTGESKLSVIKDGFRFLKVILDSTFLYRPSRPLALIGLLCLIVSCGLMAVPVVFYLSNHAVEEWMIYRFIVSNLLGTSAFLLFCMSYLSKKLVDITLSIRPYEAMNQKRGGRFFSFTWVGIISCLLLITGGLLVLPSFLQLLQTGATYEHWSRFVVMSFFYQVVAILVVTKIMDYIMDLIFIQASYLKSEPHMR